MATGSHGLVMRSDERVQAVSAEGAGVQKCQIQERNRNMKWKARRCMLQAVHIVLENFRKTVHVFRGLMVRNYDLEIGRYHRDDGLHILGRKTTPCTSHNGIATRSSSARRHHSLRWLHPVCGDGKRRTSAPNRARKDAAAMAE